MAGWGALDLCIVDAGDAGCRSCWLVSLPVSPAHDDGSHEICQFAEHQILTNSAPRFFSYFTNLSYIGLCAYFFASFVQTFAYARRAKKSGALTPNPGRTTH